jgi:hypothetical protein
MVVFTNATQSEHKKMGETGQQLWVAILPFFVRAYTSQSLFLMYGTSGLNLQSMISCARTSQFTAPSVGRET